MSTPQSEGSEQDRTEEEVFQALRKATEADLRGLAKLLADTPDDRLFGQNEFKVREQTLRVGAKAFAAALAARKKGATKVPVGPAPLVPARPGSSDIGDARS